MGADRGRKRFIVTDTLGLLLTVVVLTAGVQDRDGAKPVLLDMGCPAISGPLTLRRLCCELPIHVLVAYFMWSPVAER